MKYIVFTLLFSLFLCTSGRAQEHYAGLEYVQGPTYTVYDHPVGPKVYWKGEPASITQITTTEDGPIEVAPPGSANPRLLIYVSDDNRLVRVVDLEYESDPRQPHATVASATRAITKPIEISFKNGLYFYFSEGKASATFRGQPLPVTGSAGRYRIETDEFEAGIAFGPQWNGNVYHYLREKQ